MILKGCRMFCFLTALVGLVACGGGGGDDTTPYVQAQGQLVNSTGASLGTIRVGEQEFIVCQDCETEFQKISQPTSFVSLELFHMMDTFWSEIGNLGPFEDNNHYAVNITLNSGAYCAELWRRADTNSLFNDDTAKQFIDSVCLSNIAAGTWFIDNPGETISYTYPDIYVHTTTYVAADNATNLTDVGGFFNGPGIGSYQVLTADSFLLRIGSNSSPTISYDNMVCTLTSATAGNCHVPPDILAFPIRKVTDPAACEGNWSGTMTDGNTAAVYNIDISVAADGVITWNSGDFTPPVEGRLFCDSGDAVAFIRTGESYTTDYDYLRLKGSLSVTTITGTYETSTGSPYDDGALSLTKY